MKFPFIPEILRNYIRDNAGESFKQIASAGRLEHVDRFELNHPQLARIPLTVLRDYLLDGQSEYLYQWRILDDEITEFDIHASEPFDGLRLTIYGIQHLCPAVVTAEFSTSDGPVHDSVSIDNIGHAIHGIRYGVELCSEYKSHDATVRISQKDTGSRERTLCSMTNRLLSVAFGVTVSDATVPRIGPPVVSVPTVSRDRPPIYLISIDSLRHDVAPFHDLIKRFSGFEVPREPRTNSPWTAAAHGTMFTGALMGDHEYVGGRQSTRVTDAMVTLPELLAEHGYVCRGVSSHPRVRPGVGLGRGFHSFRLQHMTDWLTHRNDSRTAVNVVGEWIDEDALTALPVPSFNFVHILDPHPPFLPPHSGASDMGVDMPAIKHVLESHTGHGDATFDPRHAVSARESYDTTVEYVAHNIDRLLMQLQRSGQYADALIIITGDDGEHFGEHGMFGHGSVYDANIRPFCAVKPPADADWSVPATPDTVDIFPTIARSIGTAIPRQCVGTPWQDSHAHRDRRLVEAISMDGYQLSVESDGYQYVLTFANSYPERITEGEFRDGPRKLQIFDTQQVREGTYTDLAGRHEAPPENIMRFVDDQITFPH
jgi:hypothetical protein